VLYLMSDQTLLIMAQNLECLPLSLKMQFKGH